MTQENAMLITFLSVDNSHRIFLLSYLMFMAENKGKENFCQQLWIQWIAKLSFSQNQDYSCVLKHRNSYYFNYSFLRAWCVTKPVAMTLKIHFSRIYKMRQNIIVKPQNVTDLDFPDFRTTNCQPFVCHLQCSKGCSPSTHPQVPSLSKHRHLMRSQTQNSMPGLFWTWNGLRLKLIYSRTPDQITVSSLFELCNIESYCIHPSIHPSVCLFIHSVIKYLLAEINAPWSHETISMGTNK